MFHCCKQNLTKWKTANTWKNASEKKTTWHNTDPPPPIHRVRIIFSNVSKFDTIASHCTNQDTTLKSQLAYFNPMVFLKINILVGSIPSFVGWTPVFLWTNPTAKCPRHQLPQFQWPKRPNRRRKSRRRKALRSSINDWWGSHGGSTVEFMAFSVDLFKHQSALRDIEFGDWTVRP